MPLAEWNRGKTLVCPMIPSCEITLSLAHRMTDNGTEIAHLNVTMVNLSMEVTHVQPTVVGLE